VKLSDLITPRTPAGTALFLQWNGYHVFSVPQRELISALHSNPQKVRFFGVGGKRHAAESLIACALRESLEEVGSAVLLHSATQTHYSRVDGTLLPLDLVGETIRPRLIMEKHQQPNGTAPDQHHQDNQFHQEVIYYVVAFEASLFSQPKPSAEIAALLYLTDAHLALLKQLVQPTLAEILAQGAQIDCQPNQMIDAETVLVPHGTARFLIRQMQ
jgi:8-oxo-dGTP pyrophosphatase MutT (NUDIX family)